MLLDIAQTLPQQRLKFSFYICNKRHAIFQCPMSKYGFSQTNFSYTFKKNK